MTKLIQISLDPVAYEILKRDAKRTGKSKSHTLRRLLYQSFAFRKAARQAPRLEAGRKKGGTKYCVIKNSAFTKQDLKGLGKI